MAVAHRAWVYFNGKPAGEHWGGFTPFTVDVTSLARAGDNELLVGVGDHRSVTDGRSWSREHVLTPVGAMYPFNRGVWQEVFLEIVPEVRIDDVFVMPSVRQMKLDVQVTVKNDGQAVGSGLLRVAVVDEGKTVKEFKPLAVTVPAGQEKVVMFSEPFTDAQLWWPDRPKLYYAKVSLNKDRQTQDEQSVRFGFREFWIDGRHFVLNGAIVTLWAVWGHTGEYIKSGVGESQEGARRMWRAVKRCNIHAARLHGQPLVPRILDAADEEGILIIAESALYGGNGHQTNSPPATGPDWGAVFHRNARQHIAEWVRRDRNHPSLVLWTSSNEYNHTHIPRTATCTRFLLELQDRIRELDPTRPVKHSGYGGMGSREMTIDFHSVQDQSIPPNGYFWAVQDIGSWNQTDRNFGSFYPKLITQIDKPVCVGEDTSEPNAAALVGPRYFLNREERIKGLAELWRVMMNAYRKTDVAMEAFFPFFDGPIPNSFLTALTDVFKPAGVFPKEYAHRFFAGSKVRRTLVTYNEAYQPRNFSVVWTAESNGRQIAGGTDSFSLAPGKLRWTEVEFTAPSAAEEQPLTLTVQLVEAGKELDVQKISGRVYPEARKFKWPEVPIALYDPRGTMRKLLETMGAIIKPITTLNDLDPSALAVFGPGCRLDELPSRQISNLRRFVERGGRALILGTDGLPAELEVKLEPIIGSRATAGFAAQTNPPALKGLTEEELKFWPEDNFIARDLFKKPEGVGKTILIAGADLSLTPLVEVPSGKGLYIFCRLLLVEKAQTEPVCRKLIVNLIRYGLRW